MDIPFLKKFSLPRFSWSLLTGRPDRVAGIDIGFSSTKVIELRYESQRAILQTYGELRNQDYFKETEPSHTGFLRYQDADIASLLTDLLAEAQVKTKHAVFSIPATTSFVITITFPRLAPKDIEQAIPYEAQKYVPIPLSEVVLDWELLDGGENRDTLEAVLVAVPREVVDKFTRIAERASLTIDSLEVETFSVVRSLIGRDQTPSALVNIGYRTTTLALVDRGMLRLSRNFGRGSDDLTAALERGMGVSRERAEAIKREVGLTERIEEKDIVSILIPLVDSLFAEIGRVIEFYNRRSPRSIQKIILTGGGSELPGLVEAAAAHFGVEVARSNPFSRIVAPAFLEPALRQIGPSFAVAAGLALHQITNR